MSLDSKPVIITYAWPGEEYKVTSVTGNIDDETLHKVMSGLRPAGLKWNDLVSAQFRATDPFGRSTALAVATTGGGPPHTIVTSKRTTDGTWYFGRRGDLDCLTVWIEGTTTEACKKLETQGDTIPMVDIRMGQTRMFAFHRPKNVTLIAAFTTDDESVYLRYVGVAPDGSWVYVGQIDDQHEFVEFEMRHNFPDLRTTYETGEFT